MSDAENIEPELLVGFRRQRRFGRGASRASAPGQIDDIGAEAVPQHQGLKSLASVGRRLPAAARLPVTVDEDQRYPVCTGRYLEIDDGMVGVVALPLFDGRSETDKPAVVVFPRVLQHRPADGETALPGDRERGHRFGKMLSETADPDKGGE